MQRLVGCLSVGLVMTILAAASVAQDNSAGPAFESDYSPLSEQILKRIDRLCIQQVAPLPNGNPGVVGFRLNRADNPWLPPLDTPIQEFRSPFGWTWRPDPVYNAWLVSSPTPMPLNQELCFGHPITRRLTAGEVERLIAEDTNRRAVYLFTSQQVVPEAKRGELPLVYNLPQQDVTATFTSPSSACGLARNFTTGLKIGVRNNLATIVEPRTGDTVKGTVNPKTYTFKATGETEVYAGGIKGLVAWASYGYTRIFGGQPCTAGYLAQINLIKPATIAPACKSPQIVAPRRVVYRSGRFHIRVGARCAGRYVAGLKLRIGLRVVNRVTRIGTFTTKATPAPATIRGFKVEENPPQPRRTFFVYFRSPPQMGLGSGEKLVEILFPRK